MCSALSHTVSVRFIHITETEIGAAEFKPTIFCVKSESSIHLIPTTNITCATPYTQQTYLLVSVSQNDYFSRRIN